MMKKLTLIPSLFLFFLISNQIKAQDAMAFQNNPADRLEQNTGIQSPQITFLEKSYDFKEARVGDVITKTFYFKNTGTQPLIIYDVQTSCGCTAISWVQEVIQPNQSGKIQVTYDTDIKKDQIGFQKKVVMIISNAANAEEKLTLEGNISE